MFTNGLNELKFHTNLYGVGSAAYYLTTNGKEFVAATAPHVSRFTAAASLKLTQFANYIGAGTAYSTYAPIVAEKLGKLSIDFKALTTVSPLHGVVAGVSLTLLAAQVEKGMDYIGMDGKKWAVIRVPASYAIAGAAVFGASLLAVKVGLAATALTVGGAVTLTATSLAVNVAVRSVFTLFECCSGSAPIEPNNKQQKPQETNQPPAPKQQPAPKPPTYLAPAN